MVGRSLRALRASWLLTPTSTLFGLRQRGCNQPFLSNVGRRRFSHSRQHPDLAWLPLRRGETGGATRHSQLACKAKTRVENSISRRDSEGCDTTDIYVLHHASVNYVGRYRISPCHVMLSQMPRAESSYDRVPIPRLSNPIPLHQTPHHPSMT